MTLSKIEGMITSLGHEPHNYVMLYMEVEDIPAYCEKVESLGGKVLIPQTEAPGQGHFAWLADPEGNIFGLVIALLLIWYYIRILSTPI